MLRTLAFLSLILALASCKQGVGGICQIDSDCESGQCSNVTNQSVQHCVTGEQPSPPDAEPGEAPDAGPPIDAGPPDGTPAPDAGPPDAAI
jgi:hypothetical protein